MSSEVPASSDHRLLRGSGHPGTGSVLCHVRAATWPNGSCRPGCQVCVCVLVPAGVDGMEWGCCEELCGYRVCVYKCVCLFVHVQWWMGGVCLCECMWVYVCAHWWDGQVGGFMAAVCVGVCRLAVCTQQCMCRCVSASVSVCGYMCSGMHADGCECTCMYARV